jgi:hypothetical protein
MDSISTGTNDAERARALLSHRYCPDDNWYSCPQAPEGCSDDSKGDKCDCGYEARLAAILAAFGEVRAEEATRIEALEALHADALEMVSNEHAHGYRRGQAERDVEWSKASGVPDGFMLDPDAFKMLFDEEIQRGKDAARAEGRAAGLGEAAVYAIQTPDCKGKDIAFVLATMARSAEAGKPTR